MSAFRPVVESQSSALLQMFLSQRKHFGGLYIAPSKAHNAHQNSHFTNWLTVRVSDRVIISHTIRVQKRTRPPHFSVCKLSS
jgi:hypothetical protein